MKKSCFAIWLLMIVPCFAQDAIVLRMGEVIAEKLWAGAFADVVYRGDRDKIITADGKIKDIGRNTFVIGKGFWKETIAFERVDRIILGKDKKLVARVKSKLDGKTPKMRSHQSVVFGQVFLGSALGLVGGALGAVAGLGIDQDTDGVIVPAGPIIGVFAGMALGSAWGVTWAGQSALEKPIFARALGGSVLGLGLGLRALAAGESLWPVFLIAPSVLGTAFSWVGNERKYNPVTIGVGLLPNGGQGVSATWHF